MLDNCCAFTGHRPHKLPWRYDETDSRCVALKVALTGQITQLVNVGVTAFYSGGADGVDCWASLIVLELRRKNPALKLHLILPHEGQADRWRTVISWNRCGMWPLLLNFTERSRTMKRSAISSAIPASEFVNPMRMGSSTWSLCVEIRQPVVSGWNCPLTGYMGTVPCWNGISIGRVENGNENWRFCLYPPVLHSSDQCCLCHQSGGPCCRVLRADLLQGRLHHPGEIPGYVPHGVCRRSQGSAP